jgi:N,N-dimethylformamidase beta subunit-like, C-terminal
MATQLQALCAGLAAVLLLTLGAWSAGTSQPGSDELDGRAPTTAELQPSVEAAFPRESYAPGSTAKLVISNRAKGLSLQLFRVGPERVITRSDSTMRGVAVTPKHSIGMSRGRRVVQIRIGNWPSGLYFARLAASDGRGGFAPLVVRPGRLGEHRVALVMPTLTWQAYNLRDDNGDGEGDSWYADWRHKTVRLGRPLLNRGVPYNFRRYDLPLLRWLAQTGREVDVLAQADLEAVGNVRQLADAYELIVFPGHHEYVTAREYDVVERYRDLGGNLMFLSANNFFWRVTRRGPVIERTHLWRKLGRPEASLIGVQYRANARFRAPWVVRYAAASSWVFEGTGLRAGSRFGFGGIEIDETTVASPRRVQVLAEIPDVFGPGFTAQMSYYETRAGAKVFAAGAFFFHRMVETDPRTARIVENLWARLAPVSSRPR